MADAVTSQTIYDGKKYAVMKFTNVSDSTGESAVAKVTASSLAGAPTSLSILDIDYDISGMKVELLWDANTPIIAQVLSAGQFSLDYEDFGGLQNNAGTGKNGNIKLTTVGAVANSTYSIVLTMRKKYN